LKNLVYRFMVRLRQLLVERVKLALAIIQIEDRFATSYVIVRPRDTTPLIDVVALEQMGLRIDPSIGKFIKGLSLML